MTIAPRKSLEPWLPDSVEFYPHQIEGIRKAARMRSFLLADEMGLGKTLQALVTFIVDVAQGWSETAIVVAPVTLKQNWKEEIETFTRLPHLVLDGTPVQRAKQLTEFEALEAPKILITNYEQIKPHLKPLNAMKFDVGIFDEAHYLKNPKAIRTKSSQLLQTTRSFMLTGTPMLNHVNELWSILHRIDPGAYPNYWTFMNRYCVFGGYQDKQIVGVKNEKELIERLQGVMIRRLKKDVLNLPEVQIIPRMVDLLPEQKKLYDQVMDELRMEGLDGADDMEIDNALTKFLRLKQICGTTFPFTGVDVSGKLDLAISDAVELLDNGHKIVMFTQFRDVLKCYGDRLEAAAPHIDFWELHGDVPKEKRQGIVNRWSAHKEPAVMVCMLQVAGIGLNMTAARHGQFVDKLFVPGLNKQAIDRMHRIGADETQPVQILDYRTRKTIESRVETILKTKAGLFDTVVETSNWKLKLMQALLEDND